MDKIQALLLVEILGKPVEHVKTSIQGIIERMGKEKGVKILSKIIHDPIQAKNSKIMFTTFAEIEAEFDTIENYISVLFAYMPSSVEIIKPEKLTISNSYFGEISSTLIQRLHQYDALTKKAIVDRDYVLKRLKEVNLDEYRKLITPLEEKDR